jgi:alpha-L-rhamnosidase
MQWGFQTLAGIDTDGPAFKRILIQPRPPLPGSNPEHNPIDWVRARYDSVRGPILSEWRYTDRQFELRIQIPANTTAAVQLPVRNAADVREGGASLRKRFATSVVTNPSGALAIEIPSGTYRFTCPWPPKP